MKIVRTLLFFVGLSVSTALISQVKEPRFALDALYLAPDGTTISIPGEIGAYTIVNSINIKGNAAKIRIPKADEIHIVVRVKNTNDNPEDVFRAFVLKVGKDKRTAGVGTAHSPSKDEIKFSGRKFGEHCYEIIFSNLAPGEYALWYKTGGFVSKDYPMTLFAVE